MDIFSIITLLGGLTFFLYGMHLLSAGLEKMAGSSLEKILKKMTSTPIKGLLLGVGVTAAIQSSSVVTVMLVGFVNSGIMQLNQTVGIIMGSNIGTTVTAWILSMVGIESNNVWIKLLKPENFSAIMAFVGILLIMASKNKKKRDIGGIMVAFAILMYGMKLMSSAVEPLRDMPEFAEVLLMFTNPLFGVLVGALFTAVIQSSSASVGILQALALTGSVPYSVAIPIIMGQNIGTCITSVLSSIGVNKDAKRVAVIHVSFNLIGTVIIGSAFYLINLIWPLSFFNSPIGVLEVAIVHSLFNFMTTLLLLPANKLLVKIATFFVKDNNEKLEYTFLDDRLLNTPSVAIAECRNASEQMAKVASDSVLNAMKLMVDYQSELASTVKKQEDELDVFEDRMGTYLLKLSNRDVSEKDNRIIAQMLHTIGDFERLGDHAVNILKVAQEIQDKGICFSCYAQDEIKLLEAAIAEILDMTTRSFVENDLVLAGRVEPLEQVIDDLIIQMKNSHVERLQSGNCTIELGFILADLLGNYERVSDHCSNIAVALIEAEHDSFDTHRYLSGIKTADNVEFTTAYKEYSEKYHIELSK